MSASGNSSNTSNARTRILWLGKFSMATFEAVMLLEIVWYTVTGEALHSAIASWYDEFKEQRLFDLEVARTLRSIRGLDET